MSGYNHIHIKLPTNFLDTQHDITTQVPDKFWTNFKLVYLHIEVPGGASLDTILSRIDLGEGVFYLGNMVHLGSGFSVNINVSGNRVIITVSRVG